MNAVLDVSIEIDVPAVLLSCKWWERGWRKTSFSATNILQKLRKARGTQQTRGVRRNDVIDYSNFT